MMQGLAQSEPTTANIVEEEGDRKAMKGWKQGWTATQFGGSGSDFWNQSKN